MKFPSSSARPSSPRTHFFVPQEHLTIARRFNAGFRCEQIQVPPGRPSQSPAIFSRPGGTVFPTGLFPALKRRAIFRKSLWDCALLIIAAILFFAAGATAETTNTLSDAEIQGRQLVRKILEQRPADNFTNMGVLNIRRAHGSSTNFAIKCTVIVTPTNWQSVYQAGVATASGNAMSDGGWLKLTVTHNGTKQDGADIENYVLTEKTVGLDWSSEVDALITSEADITKPFSTSDFWLADLGLEFFHWPQQKVLKKEVRRSCGCTVLESTNPHPSTNGYSRVVSWIDSESLGIVEAYAYDVHGKKLKNFYPKNLEKVNGQYQVQTMIMENLQTGSKTRLEFDLKK